MIMLNFFYELVFGVVIVVYYVVDVVDILGNFFDYSIYLSGGDNNSYFIEMLY